MQGGEGEGEGLGRPLGAVVKQELTLLSAYHQAGTVTNASQVLVHRNLEMSLDYVISIPILQMKKLRPGEVKRSAHGLTSWERKGLGWNPGLSDPEALLLLIRQ